MEEELRSLERKAAHGKDPTQVNVSHPRCPFCHEPVKPEEAKEACASCQAWQHLPCWVESDHKCCSCGSVSPTFAYQEQMQISANRELKLVLAGFVPLFGLIGYLIGGVWESPYYGAFYGALVGFFVGTLLPTTLAMAHLRRQLREDKKKQEAQARQAESEQTDEAKPFMGKKEMA